MANEPSDSMNSNSGRKQCHPVVGCVCDEVYFDDEVDFDEPIDEDENGKTTWLFQDSNEHRGASETSFNGSSFQESSSSSSDNSLDNPSSSVANSASNDQSTLSPPSYVESISDQAQSSLNKSFSNSLAQYESTFAKGDMDSKSLPFEPIGELASDHSCESVSDFADPELMSEPSVSSVDEYDETSDEYDQPSMEDYAAAEEEEDDDESSLDDSTAPTIPTTLHAKYDIQLSQYHIHEDHTPTRIDISTRIDVDEAVQHYNTMSTLLGPSSKSPPIITCHPSAETDGVQTVEPVNLQELKNALEREPKEEIGELYDTIMKELRMGRKEVEEDGGIVNDISAQVSPKGATSMGEDDDAASQSKRTNQDSTLDTRDKVECLLECYAGIAGGSTLPSTLGGSTTVVSTATSAETPHFDINAMSSMTETLQTNLMPKQMTKSNILRRKILNKKNRKSLNNINASNSKNKIAISGIHKRPSVFKQIFSKRKIYTTKRSHVKKKNETMTVAAYNPHCIAPPSLISESVIMGGNAIESGQVTSQQSQSAQITSKESNDGCSEGKGEKDGIVTPSLISAKISVVAPSIATSTIATQSVAPSTVTTPPTVVPSTTPPISARISIQSLVQLLHPFFKNSADSIQDSIASAQESLVASVKSNGRYGTNSPPIRSLSLLPFSARSSNAAGAIESNKSNLPWIGTGSFREPQVRSTAKGFEVVRDDELGKDKIMVSRPSNKLAIKRGRSTTTSGKSTTNTVLAAASTKYKGQDGLTISTKVGDDADEDGLFESGSKSSNKIFILEDGVMVPEEAMKAVHVPTKNLFEEEENIISGSDETTIEERKNFSATDMAMNMSRRARSVGRSRSCNGDHGGSHLSRRSRSLLGRKNHIKSKKEEEEGTGSLCEDSRRRSKSSKEIVLEDRGLVRKNALEPKSLAKSLKSMRSRSRGRSLTPLCRGRKSKSKTRDNTSRRSMVEEEDTGGLWGEGSQKPNAVPKRIRKMKKNTRRRSLSRRRSPAGSNNDSDTEPGNGPRAKTKAKKKSRRLRREKKQTRGEARMDRESTKRASRQRFKSPVRFRVRNANDRVQIDDSEIETVKMEDQPEIEFLSEHDAMAQEIALEKKKSSRFMNPNRFRSPMRRARRKNKTITDEVYFSDAEFAASKTSPSLEERRIDPAGILVSKTNSRSTTSSKHKKKSVASATNGSASIAMSAKSKTTCVSWSIPVSVAKSKSKAESIVKSNSSAMSNMESDTDISISSSTSSKKSNKSFRGWEDKNDVTDDDVSFVERELYTFSEQLVSKGVNWLNGRPESKLLETQQADARSDNDDVTDKRKSVAGAWFNWNVVAKDDNDNEMRESADEALPHREVNAWSGGSRDNDPETDNTGSDANCLSEEDDDPETDKTGSDANCLSEEDDASREEIEDDRATLATTEHTSDGWLFPLANYFVNPHLGDIGLTDAEEDDDDRDDLRVEDSMRRSRYRRSDKSRKSHRSNSDLRSNGSGSSSRFKPRHHRPKSPARSSSPTGRDSPEMDSVLLLI